MCIRDSQKIMPDEVWIHNHASDQLIPEDDLSRIVESIEGLSYLKGQIIWHNDNQKVIRMHYEVLALSSEDIDPLCQSDMAIVHKLAKSLGAYVSVNGKRIDCHGNIIKRRGCSSILTLIIGLSSIAVYSVKQLSL